MAPAPEHGLCQREPQSEQQANSKAGVERVPVQQTRRIFLE